MLVASVGLFRQAPFHAMNAQDEEMRLREVEEAEKKQMMKERQQKLLEGQLVRRGARTERPRVR